MEVRSKRIAMAITRSQNVSANANNVALASTTSGDLIVVFAYCNNATTIPSLPGGFTSLATFSGNLNGMRCGYKVSTGGETTSGTWTNATNIAAHVYQGVHGSTPIGAQDGATGTQGNGTALSWTGFTLNDTSGNSWIAGFVGAKAATAGINGNTTGGTVLTNRTNQTVISGKDTGSGTATFSTTSLTVTGSGRWASFGVEIRAPVTINPGGAFFGFM